MVVIKAVGTDIVEIGRIAGAITRPKFIERVFTREETAYCRQKKQAAASFAARFAAKEAVMKALGVGLWQVGWQDIEVINDVHGRPSIRLTGRGLREFERQGLGRLLLSLSHSRDYAVAMVVATDGEG